jgi:hypothetical protein
MSKTIPRPPKICNQRSAEPDLLPTTRAARKLAARYGLSLAHASTIANLAGLGINGEAR